MGYRPDRESISIPADKINLGIKELRESIKNRNNDPVDPWSEEHLKELRKLKKLAKKFQKELNKVTSTTW